ncbi:MAG: HD domain-containing phosphohydrolase [Gammaproteobacteria bacterium]|nr:HD domain-containing phosphohydrolase [Gammaproteobacteria bacterium]
MSTASVTASSRRQQDRGKSIPEPVARYPLHVTLAVLFAVILVLFGGALTAFNFVESRRMALLATDDVLARISKHTSTSIAALYGPVQNLVDISSRSVETRGKSLKERMQLLGYLTEALRLNPNIASLFLGDVDGDFFLVRSFLGGQEVARAAMKAPPSAAYAVQSVERVDDQVVREEWSFFNDKLFLLETRPPQRLRYDPRKQDWFKAAIHNAVQITSDFYVYFTTREVGVTMARRLAEGGAVLGADLTLQSLSSGLAAHRVTPSTRVAMVDDDGRMIAFSDFPPSTPPVSGTYSRSLELPRLEDSPDPVMRQLAARYAPVSETARFDFAVAGKEWLASLSPLPTRSGEGLYLAMVLPRDELLAEVTRVRNQSVLISAGLLLVALLVVLGVARKVSRPLRALAREAEQIREFKLDTPVTVQSRIHEVDNLAHTMGVMKSSIQQFLAISKALSAEKDYDRLLEMILDEARTVSRAEAGAILLASDDGSMLEVSILQNEKTGIRLGGTSGREAALEAVRLRSGDEGSADGTVDAATVSRRQVIRLDELSSEESLNCRDVEERFGQLDYRCQSLLSVPLTNRKREIVGVLQLVNARTPAGDIAGFRDEIVSYIQALSSEAAVALDNRRLLKAQKDLLDSFIQVVAGAIDAKSPYTHGHCQRVPELAQLLAQAAHATDQGRLADFRLSNDEWEELHIASWLHDCGKVTTPEYVVDKATKLETIYNRIHEVRTRFEILWRDAEIEYHRALANGEASAFELRERLEHRHDAIRDDYAFVAECNIGGEFMSQDRVTRLKDIAAKTWVRHLDDRLGLSNDELRRAQRAVESPLPAVEPLIADKAEHIVLRDPGHSPFGDNALGFRMDIPTDLYNHGELYNLCIPRGTLTPEERFKVNEHIIQTIIMLDRLPFPRELKRVPEWAGSHHEKLDGTGYPRRLSASNLSVPERIMAMADIFEALTAADRPYKSGRTLTESLHIMSRMRDEKHICPDLFDLFLTSGVYLAYGRKFLRPDQLDEVDVNEFLQRDS